MSIKLGESLEDRHVEGVRLKVYAPLTCGCRQLLACA